MKKLLLLTATALVFGSGEPAAAFGRGDKGTSSAQFLKIAPGARPAGMGEAFAGVADDLHAIYYNPGGLGFLKGVEVGGMHNSHFQGINYEFAGLILPLLSWIDTKEERNSYGVMGAAIYSLSVGGIQRRGVVETDSPVDTFGSSDFAYALSYAYAVPETGVSLGATGKFIDSTIDAARGTAFAADLGALYYGEKAKVGAGVRNFGTKQKFASVADPLPLVLFTGVGYKLGENWLGSVEVDAPRDNKISFGLGTEYVHAFADKLTGALRGGFNSRNTDAGGLSGASFGLGIGYANFNFDFAFVPFGDLGNTFKYSLVVKF